MVTEEDEDDDKEAYEMAKEEETIEDDGTLSIMTYQTSHYEVEGFHTKDTNSHAGR